MLDRRGFIAALVAAVPTAAGARGLDMRPPRKPMPEPGDVVAASGLQGKIAFALLDGRQPAALGKAALAMAPASTMKVITALFALDRLGPGHRFGTRLIRAGDMLILAGGGDPVLSSDDLARLAATLASSGSPPPRRFAVWGGALPSIAQIAPEQAVHLAYNPTISGMILNFNRVHLGWTRVGVNHQLSVEARATGQSLRAYTISAMPATHADLFTYRHDIEREYWTISRAAMGPSGSRWLPVRLPELYAADVFQTLCRARGLVLPQPEVIAHLPQGEVIARHDSPPLRTLVHDMLLYSTNITAETLGLHASGANTLPTSADAMSGWLGGLGKGMRLADHSGLSEASRVSAFGLASVLAGPGRDLGLGPLLRTDPLDEDLGPGQADHRVSAKTGTLNFVSNLAGYVTTRSGREGAFAILCTDEARRATSIGEELPDDVSTWTHAAKSLQRDLIGAFAGRLGG
ncbi:D-alanyl-D-alanine carboxypeptidase/D-alanyl-D-alanine endopeptidase [Paracoccus beibuensis]|uniref:D-alanyl-D-alanine carboxypeptidase/D-alanyl-D-alanine endopeptidase n=1 Tax=Paracoccus beibuensis TaxID=547602 RepID=UPI00223F9456|nr:D-alanyl-D-alanine carboxypeptidase/D-alanyl-D-alanine-endopeptidase [Paracoccus beibuensis]